jgi:hypothetical protein
MGAFVAAAKNTMLDALTVDRLSLHSGAPGTDGLSNELSGGTPAYARKACVYAAASGGERLLNADVTFDVPASTSVQYVGKWNYNNGTMIFHGSDQVTTESYGAQGQYIVKATTSKLSLTDPA